jgi:quercetin dioxygenase-like cupin family protein
MSAGLYVLAAGGEDTQSPHREDELYYVIRGKARFSAATDDRAVKAGSLIFVAAEVTHRFYDITEDLQVLVFFAPAETPDANSAAGCLSMSTTISTIGPTVASVIVSAMIALNCAPREP